MDHRDQPARRATVDAVTSADLCNRSDLYIHLGAPLADRKITPNAGMRLCAATVEGDHSGYAPACRIFACAWSEGIDVVAVEAAWFDAFSLGNRNRLPAEPTPQLEKLFPCKAVGNTHLTECLSE